MKSAGARLRTNRSARLGAMMMCAALVVTGYCVRQPAALAADQPTEAPDAGSAIAAAAASGRPVEVTSARTETVQVFAQPSGRLTMEAAVVPQRTRRADGRWAPVDLSLARGADELWRPQASVADVGFSGGGTAPLVTLRRDGRTMTLSWPGRLPVPVISGDSATYREVLPEVDLTVRATRTGFTHVLIVKSARAAADPAVKNIRFSWGGDARVEVRPDGGLQAVASDGAVLATADPAAMWDSGAPKGNGKPGRLLPDGAPGGGTGPPGEQATAEAPADTSRIAPVAAEVNADGNILLRPDESVLRDAKSFPLYIDPPWSTSRARWAYATNNNTNNSDLSVARVGADPDSGKRYRSYFEFPLKALHGRHIESAYVQMKLDHSWSCTNTPTSMFQTGGIASVPRTAWAPGHVSWLASANSHANEGTGCSDSPQPDMTVNFLNARVTGAIQTHATKKWAAITVGFCACDADGTDEGVTARWKKFFPNSAKLIVDYSSYPGIPTGTRVAGVACAATGATSVGTTAPTLSAVYPDADSTQALSAAFEWVEVPASGTITDSTPRRPAPGNRSVPAGGRATSAALTGAQNGKQYAFRTRATDPAPYSLTSGWSPWCRFKVDTTVPAAPAVTPVTVPPGPGTAGTFTLTSTDGDVAKFRYGWTADALSEVAATGTGTRTATVTATAPRYGDNTLYAYAIDATGNKGNTGSAEFTVARPAPAVARWGLETYPGTDVSAALADQQAASEGDTPLSASNVTWTPDARLVGGQTATFDGTSSTATAAGSVVDSSRSFSVSAWVRVTDVTKYHAIVSKDGAAGQWSPFRLQLLATTPAKWCLSINAALDANKITYGCSTVPPVANRWTHLAASYDQVEGRIRIWVDGALTETPFAGGVNSSGPLVVGRAMNAGAPADRLHGSVADLRVYRRVLVANDLTGQLADDPGSGGVDEPGMLDPVEVGRWDFNAAVACYQVDLPDTCRAPDGAAWGRRLALTSGVDVGVGLTDAGLLLDGTHFAPDPADPLHGVATQEYGRSQRNTVGEGQPPQWQDTPVLRTDVAFTVSAWVRLDAVTGWRVVVSQDTVGTGFDGFELGFRDSNDGEWYFAMRNSPAESDAAKSSIVVAPAENPTGWHHVAATYDPGRRQVRLYVDGDPAGTATTHVGHTPWQATGPLVVGRSDRPGGPGDWLYGTVDDLIAYQGAMSDAAVKALHDLQSPDL